ncbi:MAG: TonB family protein [Chthoniobacterales bacterium]
MKQSQLAIVSGIILLTILAVSWCARKPAPQYTGVPVATQAPTPVATAAASPAAGAQSPSPELRKVTERVAPAVILISVFDEPGKLLRTGTGFFISEDGKFVTNRHIVAEGAYGVAKTGDGGIYNVTGTLIEAEAADVAVLQAEVKKPVHFLSSGRAAGAQPGTRVAAVASPLARGVAPLFAATVAGASADENGERLQLAPPPPNEMIGAPVINEKGELLGLVMPQAGKAGAPNVVRSSSALDLLVAKIGSGAKPRWPPATARGSPSPLPTAQEELAGATPTPMPVTRTVTTTTARIGKPRIIYDPKPAYPAYSYFHEKGSGRFRISFSANGTVKNIDVVESTKSATLDNITIEALRRWRATPGQEWNIMVPVTFERRR